MKVVCVEATKYYDCGFAVAKMQYDTLLGRERKGSVSSMHNVTNWFSSLRRVPKKNRGAHKAELTSRSVWDLSASSRSASNKRPVCW